MVYGEDLVLSELKNLSINKELTERLSNLGLNEYECKIFLASVLIGVGTAETLAKEAGIPRTAAYRAIEGLISKGFLRRFEGRPSRYEAVDISRIESIMLNDMRETFEFLRSLQESFKSENTAATRNIWGSGQIEKVVADAFHTSGPVTLVVPKASVLRGAVLEGLKGAVKRGGDIRILTNFGQRMPRIGAEIKRVYGLSIAAVVSDQSVVIYDANYTFCIESTNPLLIGFIREIVDNIGSGRS